MKVQLKTPAELLSQGRAALAEIKRKAISAVGQEARRIVKEESDGQMEARLDFVPEGFVVAEPKTAKDPEGRKVKEVERKTQAYSKANLKLSDKGYVASVINRAK